MIPITICIPLLLELELELLDRQERKNKES